MRRFVIHIYVSISICFRESFALQFESYNLAYKEYKMRYEPSWLEIQALFAGGFVSESHPKRIIMERRRLKQSMLQRGQYRGHLPVTDKFRVRIYDGLFSKRGSHDI